MEWKAFWIGSIFTAIFLEAIQGQLEADVIRYRIQEGSPVGTFVGDVAGDSGLLDILPEDAMQDIQYNFLDATGAFMNSHPYLAISPETGILTTAQVIDREKFCSTRSTCYLDVEVAISPTAYFQVINIRLEIQDVNDNTPDFGQLTAFIDIPESALVGSGYTLPLASDPDGLEYGITAYSIESRSGVPFELQVIPNIQDPLSLELVVREPLDRETVAGYEFYVVARDGGTPAKTARLKVNVTVTDINDNHPVFRSEQYTVRVMENSVVPKQLISVSATDADYGANGRITYEFSSTTRDNFGHLFEVDQDSGMITLVEPLDREEVSEYTLTVTARDRGVGSRLASTNVIVTVLDDNDNNPKVNVNSPTEDGKPVVSEAASIGTFIALVSVTDSDLGQNGVVTCTVNSSKFDIRPLQKRKYKIVTASIFDRESTEVYNITLTCHDHGTPMQVTNTLVSIQIGDENDHAPVFDQAFYEAEVEENSPPGMTVAQVKATDNDAGANAQITYTLYGQLSHYFEVDPMSGIITTHTELDHETYSELSITVGAKDNGDPQLSSNTEVRIKVKDVNDEAPIFTQDVYTFVAVENKPRGFELGRVEAFDRDAAPFNHITYAITDTINRTSGLNVFDLDKDSGIISTKVTLDRETTPVYFLIIAASNEGFEGLTGTATVTIFVADDNDNAPVLDFPNKDNNTVTISSHANEHDIVTQIRSHDLDTGHNAAVSYELRMYDEAFWDAFIIDSLSGLVYVNKDLSYITEFTTIKVKVTATDQGTITLAAQGDLFVHVDPNLKVIVDIPTDYNDSGAHDDRKQGEEDNMFVIIVVVAISGVLIIILLTAIIFVLLRSRRSRHESRNGVKALPSSASNVGKTVEANKYVTEEVEWIKGDPETGSQLSDSKVLYKKPLKQNNTKAGRASPAVVSCIFSQLRKNDSISQENVLPVIILMLEIVRMNTLLGFQYILPLQESNIWWGFLVMLHEPFPIVLDGMVDDIHGFWAQRWSADIGNAENSPE